MSTELSFYDFEKEADSWVAAFGPAEHQQRKDFYDIVKHEFARLKYLKVQKAVVSAKDRPMLTVSTEFRVSVRHTDMVKIDFKTVWNDFIAADQVASHYFEPKESGFCLHFALRSRKGHCLVGQIHASGIRN